jgi:hypothetical protein
MAAYHLLDSTSGMGNAYNVSRWYIYEYQEAYHYHRLDWALLIQSQPNVFLANLALLGYHVSHEYNLASHIPACCITLHKLWYHREGGDIPGKTVR